MGDGARAEQRRLKVHPPSSRKSGVILGVMGARCLAGQSESAPSVCSSPLLGHGHRRALGGVASRARGAPPALGDGIQSTPTE